MTGESPSTESPGRAGLVVSGFLPFAGNALNPSERMARRLARNPPDDVRVEAVVLPVSWSRAFPPLARKLRSERPGAVLLLGLGTGRARIEPERFALNWRSSAGADEDGHRITGEPIDRRGPAALAATADVEALARVAAATGMPSAVSCHAGTFLCNQVYHQTLRWGRRLHAIPRVAFVHLPAIRGVEPGPHVDEDALFRAVRAIALELVRPGRGSAR